MHINYKFCGNTNYEKPEHLNPRSIHQEITLRKNIKLQQMLIFVKLKVANI